MEIKLLDESLLPNGFHYPTAFKKIISLGLVRFDIWGIIRSDEIQSRFDGLKERYPSRQLIPFARRYDNDDIACFEIGYEGKVVIIHDFASQGWEQREIYDTFWDWFRSVINDMIEFEELEEYE